MKIPTKDDWGEYWKDLDQKSAYERFFGKSNAQLQSCYFDSGQDMMMELRFMNPKVFQYYVLGFRNFILKGEFPKYEASDFVSYFMEMVEYLLIHEKAKILPCIEELLPTLKYISENQELYEASADIYGDFTLKYENLIGILKESKESGLFDS
ncbi:MAG: hypothetical protein P8X89_22070 [Reinekea sp.]